MPAFHQEPRPAMSNRGPHAAQSKVLCGPV